MSEREPIAFMSYVRSDDDHDNGNITALRQRLEGELKMQLGHPFPIFQDRNDILWGQYWKERIEKSIQQVTFLIPIMTPSYFRSDACRFEFMTFKKKEAQLGLNLMILPLYYVKCKQLSQEFPSGQDDIADEVRRRNWTDWRPFRFKAFSEPEVLRATAELAEKIEGCMAQLQREIDSEIEARKKVTLSPKKKTKRSQDTQKQHTTLIEPTEGYTPNIYVARIGDTFSIDSLRALYSQPYYVYTTMYDEEVRAEHIIDTDTIIQMHALVANMVTKLQTSALDKLTSEVINKAKSNASFSVTLLLDNSGSMRGQKIWNVAAWASLLTEVLERAGIDVEVLGYTTRAWKGGQSRETWLVDKKPPQPGRLNDLRHIVYKDFSESYLIAAHNFAAMLREGLLKENIDGEALLWAFSRIKRLSTEKKMIVVLSDGAPVDDSTLSQNRADFLWEHLKYVSRWINSQEGFSVFGVGIDCDISVQYPWSVNVKDLEKLGHAVLLGISEYLGG